MAREFMSAYLNDHLAGAQAALEIVGLLDELGDSGVWRSIGMAIAEDRDELLRLVDTVGPPPSTLRRAAGWTAEKLAELKIRLDDPSSGALRRLELIEALAIGIDGKRALWTALQRGANGKTGLGPVNYQRLIARADEQRQIVEAERLEAAAQALR